MNGTMPAPRKSRPAPLKAADIRAIRLAADLDQEQFAERLGVSVGAVRNWEQGRRGISVFVTALVRQHFPKK